METTATSQLGRLSDLLGGTSIIVIGIVGTFLFVLWMMWMLFPLVMYFQLLGVQRHLFQLHADLIEVNLRLRESNQAAAKIPLGAAAETENPFGR